MKIVYAILATAGVTALFLWSLQLGLNNSEIEECNQWKNEWKSSSLAYRQVADFASWQIEQCKAHNIDIFAR